MASFPEPVEYKIVRNVQPVRTYVTELDQSNTPSELREVWCCRAIMRDASHDAREQWRRYPGNNDGQAASCIDQWTVETFA